MKIVFEHCENFEYRLVKTRKIKSLKLENIKGKTRIHFNNCILAKMCMETGDEDISNDRIISVFKEISQILGNYKFVIFPYAHLSSQVLEYNKAKSLFDTIFGELEKRFKVFKVPIGYDKSYKIEVKGHSYNVMFREIKNQEQTIIEAYDDIMSNNKEYNSMIKKLASMVSGNILEIGVGTGLYTKNLIESYTGIEPNHLYYKKAIQKIPLISVLKEDGLSYKGNPVDTVTMALVYHHIPDDKKLRFLRKCFDHLIHGGKLIIGDIFLFNYNSEKERDELLIDFYKFKIKKAKTEQEKELLNKALQDGLNRNGEWKTSYDIIRKQLRMIGFSNIGYKDIGHQKYGGYKVVIAQKPKL